MFCKRKKLLQVWNKWRVSKWWQNFHLRVNKWTIALRQLNLEKFTKPAVHKVKETPQRNKVEAALKDKKAVEQRESTLQKENVTE